MEHRPILRGTKSNFSLAYNIKNITDERVKQYLRTEIVVKEWIEKVLQIKLKDNLHESLQNGIVLCYLANAIEDNIVPTIRENTTVGFKLKENIEFFLMAIEEIGLSKNSRFQTNDLFEAENLVRVVESLAALARFVVAEKGFHIPLRPITNTINVEMPKGEGLKVLKILLSQIKEIPDKSTSGYKPKGAAILKAQMALAAGKSIDFGKCEKGFVAFQSLWRGFKVRQMVKKIRRDIAYREKVAQEIYKTEDDYVKSLSICISGYLEPLIKSNLITKDQQKLIFSDIQIIYAFGKRLLDLLKPRTEKWFIYQKLGDIFLIIADFLKVYTSYVQNYNSSLETLEELKKKEKFLNLLNECREAPAVKNFDITAFLIMPVQRVPRYYLLLQDLVKHTWIDHPDYEPLKKAADKMKDIAAYLNEKKREGENFIKFTEIQSTLVGKVPQLFTPSRRYIRQAHFINVQKKTEIVIYLFNDCIIYGKPAKGGIIGGNQKKVKYLGIVDLPNTTVHEDPLPNVAFHIRSTTNALLFTAYPKNEDERVEWVAEIRKQIHAIAESQKIKETKLNEQQAQLNNPTVKPDPNQTVEQQLQERKKTRKFNLDDSLSSSQSNSLNSSGTNHSTTTTTTTTTTTATANSEPQQPQQNNTLSSSPSTATTSPTSPNPKEHGGFISSLFGNSKSRKSTGGSITPVSSTPTKDKDGAIHQEQVPDSSQPLSAPNSPTRVDSDSVLSPPSSAEKGHRPKKNKKHGISTTAVSKDDSEIGIKKNADGTRARSQSRLSRLTGTLTFRRKKDKSLDLSGDGDSGSNNNSNDERDDHQNINSNTATTADESQSKDSLHTSDSVSTDLSVSANNQENTGGTSPYLQSSSPTHSNRYSSSSFNSDVDSNKGPLTFEEIQQQKGDLDILQLETYLAEDEFKKLFNMERFEFNKLPKWKKDQKKRDLKLL
ncbi:hypothetical protein CYY_000003 [Polysphondylium violaceum]|uniref:RhoGEF domain-containing protein n=1 Tax=Polysphondylium violaceum TaxID=133409 RepID=A0A8J4V9D4_9MYCE|nr:hypothetical protein CYY_000003 [Polysphondylium violaceum]